ncbi:MAG: PorT family protein [Candidatus Delongbacteria bacterium]|nr:PorT family protein [Candidatus Delongbacteria bacterium]
MKKLLIAALLINVYVLTSQISDPIMWGIKGGINFAELKGDHFNDPENTYNTGIVIGLFSEKPVNDSFSIQWELLYTMKGVSMNYTEKDSDEFSEYTLEYEATLNLNYIEIPVSFRFKMPAGSGFVPSFYAGGSAAFNVSAIGSYKYSFYEYYDDGSTSFETEISESESQEVDNVNDLELGLIFGLGLNIPLENGQLLFDVRYNYGLTTVFDDGESKIYNRVLCLTAGFGF